MICCLTVEWEGTGIAYADVYEIVDGQEVLLAEKVKGSSYSMEILYEPLSRHTYKVYPYNKLYEPGAPQLSEEIVLEDNVAVVSNMQAEYDEKTNQVVISWEGSYVDFAEVSINDNTVAERYVMKPDSTEDDAVLKGEMRIKFTPQAGVSYNVSVDPYRINPITGEEALGESGKETICIGEFSVPDIETMGLRLRETVSYGKDAQKNYTGFSKPAVELTWTVSEPALAYYEVYRASSNKKNSYRYVGTVKAQKAGIVTFLDDMALVGRNYYKLRQVQKPDAYWDQELATPLSEEAKDLYIELPKPQLSARLNENGCVELTMSAGKEIVSGYAIYRKASGGSYKLIAEVTDDAYIDEAVTFGKQYSYKVKPFYYDSKAKKKYYGSVSTVSVKTTVGGFSVQAKQTSEKKAQLSWDAAANAEWYEVYYKSAASGDSYKLLKATKNLKLSVSLRRGATYSFQVKAYKHTKKGKSYFSDAETQIHMGFQGPENLRVASTSFSQDKKTKALTRKDKLSWDRVYGAKGYYIDVYNPAKKKYVRLKTVSGMKRTSCVVTNQLPGSAGTVSYRVRAYAQGKTAVGGTLTVEMKVGAPEGVKASRTAAGAKVSWKKVTGADAYRIYRSNGRNKILLGMTSKLSYQDKGLCTGVSYTYMVQAVSYKLGDGADSEPVPFIVKPPKVGDLSAVNTKKSIKITWSPETEADGYILYYKDSADGYYKKLATISGSKWTYTHKNLKEGKTYYYKVVSLQSNAGGVKAQSDGATVKAKVRKQAKKSKRSA